MSAVPAPSSPARGPEDFPPRQMHPEDPDWEDDLQQPEEDPEEDPEEEEEPEEDPEEQEEEEEEEDEPEPDEARYGWVRDQIPNPANFWHSELLDYLEYQLDGETIAQYCNYAYDLCIIGSQSEYGSAFLSHPLVICEVILGGLPGREPWIAIKAEFEDVAIRNVWGRPVPNESKYRNEEEGTYAIDPTTLSQLLRDIDLQEEVEEQEEIIEDEVIDGEVDEEDVEMDIAEELFQQEVDEDEFDVGIEAEEIDINPADIAPLYVSDDED